MENLDIGFSSNIITAFDFDGVNSVMDGDGYDVRSGVMDVRVEGLFFFSFLFFSFLFFSFFFLSFFFLIDLVIYS